MKKEIVLLALLAMVGARALTQEEGFVEPPREVRPQVWWWFSTYVQASDACNATHPSCPVAPNARRTLSSARNYARI